MFLRQPSTTTLADVAEEWGTASGSLQTTAIHNINLDLPEEFDTPDATEAERITGGTIRFGQHEVPATRRGIDLIAGLVNVPSAFLARITAEEQAIILNNRINRVGESDISLEFNGSGLLDAAPASKVRIRSTQIAEIALGVMPEESTVTDHWADDDLRLDLIVPENFDRGWGGDPAVGDITGGGVRFFQNRKQNLTPGVQPFWYRLWCTNGYESEQTGLRVDGRGKDAEEILGSLRVEAQRAFDMVEGQIEAFYDTRRQVIEDPLAEILVLASDRGLSDRLTVALTDMVQALMTERAGGDPVEPVTMFDLINLVTNAANVSTITGGAQRSLQQTGGVWVTNHAARCDSCHRTLLTH